MINRLRDWLLCLAAHLPIIIPAIYVGLSLILENMDRGVWKMPVTKSGSRTSERTKKPISIYLCTWNVAANAPIDLSEALNINSPTLPDIIAVGLQEVNTSHTGQDSSGWTYSLTKVLQPKDYVRIRERSMQGIYLVIFAKRHHLSHLTNFESEATRTGLNGLWGNKGGVSIRLDIYGINVIIVNSHLAAHREYVQERIEDYNSILDNQKFKDYDVDCILDHDYVFWMGDLNFRLNDLSKADVIQKIKEKKYEELLQHDQLHHSSKQGLVFDDFEEGEITFAPTYKFDLNTDNYDSSEKNRVPAWTDRILWYMEDSSYGSLRLDVQQLNYKSHPSYKQSDHKPVTSLFNFMVFPHPPHHPVRFKSIHQFHKRNDNLLSYSVSSSFETKRNDWIGLYKADFASFYDYVTYIWAYDGAEKRGSMGVTLRFQRAYMNIEPGEYCLAYLTKNYSLHGISNNFQVMQV